jgi:hypothetical protein
MYAYIKPKHSQTHWTQRRAAAAQQRSLDKKISALTEEMAQVQKD